MEKDSFMTLTQHQPLVIANFRPKFKFIIRFLNYKIALTDANNNIVYLL